MNITIVDNLVRACAFGRWCNLHLTLTLQETIEVSRVQLSFGEQNKIEKPNRSSHTGVLYIINASYHWANVTSLLLSSKQCSICIIDFIFTPQTVCRVIRFDVTQHWTCSDKKTTKQEFFSVSQDDRSSTLGNECRGKYWFDCIVCVPLTRAITKYKLLNFFFKFPRFSSRKSWIKKSLTKLQLLQFSTWKESGKKNENLLKCFEASWTKSLARYKGYANWIKNTKDFFLVDSSDS